MIHDALRQLHFDLAGMPTPDALPALLRVADPTRIHYGSDYPFTPLPEIQATASALDTSPELEGDLLDRMKFKNAQELFG
ncbi:amidohydrolase family protein [Streptomyces sp. URMC 127]|uniref:amidohydrolase family protein n=1 Tax=Streptomyces sp. URMC 127 TaxID=3423402 RepID=UPI003F19CC3D